MLIQMLQLEALNSQNACRRCKFESGANSYYPSIQVLINAASLHRELLQKFKSTISVQKQKARWNMIVQIQKWEKVENS